MPAARPQRDHIERRRYLQAINYARVAAILCGSLVIAFLWRGAGALPAETAIAFLTAALATLLLSLPYHRLTQAPQLTRPAYTMLTTDTVIIGLGSWIIGRPEMGIPVFFSLPIVASALVLGPAGSLLTAGIASLMYGGLLVLDGGWMAAPAETLGAFGFHAGAFFTLSLVSILLMRELNNALERTRRLRREAEIIHQINRLTERATGVTNLFRNTRRLLTMAGGFPRCGIWVLNSERAIAGGTGEPPTTDDFQVAALTAHRSTTHPARRMVEFIGPATRPVGLLIAEAGARSSTVADQEFVHRVAGQLSVSLERIQLQNATRAAEALLQATYAPSTSLSLQTVAETIAEQGAALTMADEVLATVAGQPPIEVSRGGPYWSGQPGALRNLLRETPRLLDHILISPQVVTHDLLMDWGLPAAARQVGSAIGVSLSIYGEKLGSLVAVRATDRAPFDSTAQVALGTFAERCAQAIKNARLYEHLADQMEEGRRTQAQLIQSAKLAAIGELAANVAHEINNPLTGILMNVSLALESAETEAALDALPELAVIRDEAIRARDIVRNLLDFSRQTATQLEPTDLPVVLQQTLALTNRFLDQNGVRLTVDLPAELPQVAADANQLKQVFLNLINNAVHAMPDGGTLSLRAGREDGRVAVYVQDTGIGIAPEHLSRIFDPFFSTKDAVKGTGLGLSVSHGIILKHGGTIDVTSEPGQGTTFRVALPVSVSSPEEVKCPSRSTS